MTEKKQRGGKREGAGRPAEVPCRKLCVYLDEQTIDRLRRLGSGNLSAGIRAAAEVFGVFDKPHDVEVTGAAQPHRAASVLTAGLCPGDDNGE